MDFKNSENLSKMPCRFLKGVGPQMANHLARINIHTIQDILFHLPSRYQDRTRVIPISQAHIGEHAVIEANIYHIAQPKNGKTRFLCQLKDASKILSLRFFYISSQQIKTLTVGTRLRCFGEIRLGATGLEMVHPELKIVTPDLPVDINNNLTPIYPTTAGLSQLAWRKLTEQALNLLSENKVILDFLPEVFLQKFQFPQLKEAIQYIHRPPTNAPTEVLISGKHIAQKRLIFEELLAHATSLLHIKKDVQLNKAHRFHYHTKWHEEFIKQLPFEMTGAQKKVSAEIFVDMNKDFPMQRLIQGDVGSGKTVVAALAILQACANGFQAALLAPTELLIEQHYQTFKRWFEPFGVSIVLLNGQMKTKEKNQAYAEIASGKANIILGTHAIFQQKVVFLNLALIVVDEQHRFGVEQRALLREKGEYLDCYPHQLIMTATPIPRTLAMTVYGDLNCSIIDELPPNRKPVVTSVISNSKRLEVLDRINIACQNGRQAYWVCTLITDSEILQCETVEKTFALLVQALPHLSVGMLHGKMKPQEKEKLMTRFKNKEIHLLVATTVIEVGVDVPNASLMIIENAERLGLAQLHQLRGRVGRGSLDSYCILLFQSPLSYLAQSRLNVMRETTDGFEIAEFDLKLRGPGDVLGTKQTGDISFKIADLVRDADLLPEIQSAAETIIKSYPEVLPSLIDRWLKDGSRFVCV